MCNARDDMIITLPSLAVTIIICHNTFSVHVQHQETIAGIRLMNENSLEAHNYSLLKIQKKTNLFHK